MVCFGGGGWEPISCKAHRTGKPETLLYLYENVKSSKEGISSPLFGYLHISIPLPYVFQRSQTQRMGWGWGRFERAL
jgi:hypothetical protein